MHPEARDFTLFVKQILSGFFIQKLVLDVGSEDNKTNNWFLFDKDCEYHCSVVTKDLPFKNNTFDTIISTECFEHDSDESLVKIYNMLKPDGLLCFTCTLQNKSPPCDELYKLISKDIYNSVTEINTNNLFTVWDTYYNPSTKDLYFVGIKKGDTIFESFIKYKNNGFVNISSNTTLIKLAV